MSARIVTLIDADPGRSAEICVKLSQHDIRADISESVSQLEPEALNSSAFLIYDSPGAIAGLLNWMGDNNLWRPVIAYYNAPSMARVVDAINEGANDYLPWPISVSKLQYAIDQLTGLEHSLGEQKARRRHARGRIEVLSRRERQILILVAKGCSSRSIGEYLKISPKTVEVHRAHLVMKLGVENSFEAAKLVFEAGLADDVLPRAA